MHPLSGRVARALIVIAGLGLLLFVLSNTLPELDRASHAQAYVEGDVSHGYISEGGRAIVAAGDGGAVSYVLQIVGILGMMVVLLTIVGLVERSMNQKRVGESPPPERRLDREKPDN